MRSLKLGLGGLLHLYGNGVSVRDTAKLYKASQAASRNVSDTYVRMVYAVD